VIALPAASTDTVREIASSRRSRGHRPRIRVTRVRAASIVPRATPWSPFVNDQQSPSSRWAERVIPNGFRIVASLNASTFDHEETLVVATSEEFEEAAERVRALLGVGTVSASGVPSGLGDVTILVGEDYLNG